MKYILVVDDEVDILETIVDTLEIEIDHIELTIDSAENGVQGLAKLKERGFYDLIITDLNMPEMNGIDFTENIKKTSSEIPIVVFTGHGDAAEEERLNSLGVLDMVKKPYIDDLLGVIVKVIS